MLAVGEVVIVRSEQKNRGAWTLGFLIELITGKDGAIRGAKVRTEKSTIERPVQFLYPMELSRDDTDEGPKAVKLNPEASEFRTRPKRDAAIAASLRISDAVDQDVFDNSVVKQGRVL